jgi:Spy/CpxP family protein refolding chaperone
MKPTRNPFLLLLAGLAGLATAAVLVAQPGPGRHCPMGAAMGGPMAERFLEHRLDRLAEYLELSDAQRVEAEALRDRFFADAQERIATAGTTFETIHEMAGAENPDATAIGELVIQMHRDREAMREAHDAFRAELVALLTPEQVERLEAWEAARPWGEHGGPGFHHGPDGHHGGRFSAPDEG